MKYWKKHHHYSRRHSALVFSIPFILLTAILTGEIILFSLALLFVLILYINKKYLAYVENKITIVLGNESKRLFPGENTTLRIPFENTGELPIFSGTWSFFVYDSDDSVKVLSGDHQYAHLNQEQPFAIPARSKRTYELNLEAQKRGVTQVRNIEVVIYDIFKFTSVQLQYIGPFKSEAIVYPTPKSITGLERIIQQERGSHPQPFSLHEDVMMTRGNRHYVSSDPFNRINWKASAKTEQLQTKIYEKITVSQWTIVLNIRNIDRTRQTIAHLEETLSQVAYASQFATKQQIIYELYINIKIPGNMYGMHLPLGNGKVQLMKAFELLARIRKSNMTVPIENTLNVILNRPMEQQCIMHFGAFNDVESREYANVTQTGMTVLRVISNENGAHLMPVGGKPYETIAN